MARTITIDENVGLLLTTLQRYFQSGNLNFLFGSGASTPTIQLAGGIESEISSLHEAGNSSEATQKTYDFLCELQTRNAALLSDTCPKLPNESEEAHEHRVHSAKTTLAYYVDFIASLENILNERKTKIICKQANIFTTNYDVFFEKASYEFSSLILNDGFIRTPNLDKRYVYSSRAFFNTTLNNGNLYSYQVELPSINLIKLHGSLTWRRDENEIIFDSSISKPVQARITARALKKFNNNFALVIPQKGKFRETLLDRTYYDLLRIYSNELDKENSLLVTFGFSFEDEHILDITRRGLKNPTLLIVIIAYSRDSITGYEEKFSSFNNVLIIAPSEGEAITFGVFNQLLSEVPFRVVEAA